jgi:hypothetical protein
MITLNSKYAQYNNGTLKSNVVFPFKSILKDEDNIIQSYVTILDAQIPVSFYIINSSNNSFAVIKSGISYNLTIPVGNYNGNSLITELKTQFSSYVATTATIVLSRTTGKLYFTFTDYITFNYSTSTCASILGFTQNISGTSFVLPQPLNLLGIKRLTVKSDALAVSSYSSYNSGSSSSLLTIPNDVAQFDMIAFVNQNSLNNSVLNTKVVDIIDIQIIDENGLFIDFNNQDWNMTLCISIERQRDVSTDHNLLKVLRQIKENSINPEIDKPLENLNGSTEKIPIEPNINEELQLLES